MMACLGIGGNGIGRRGVRFALIGLAVLLCAVFAHAETLELSSRAQTLYFAGAEAGYALTNIVNRLVPGANFIRPKKGVPGFWRLIFQRKTATGARETFQLTNLSFARALATGGDARQRQFTWSGLSLPGAPAAIDVTAIVALDAAEGSQSAWRIHVSNTAPDWALFSTDFPVLPSPLDNDEGHMLVPYGNLGAEYVSRATPQVHPFFNSRPMVAAFDHPAGGGLYVAARDGEARIKSTVFERENTFTFRTVVENAGVAGRAASGPGYPVVLAVYNGDWWQAAKIHRAWALKQKWARPSARRLDDVPFWLNIHGGPQETCAALTKAKRLFPEFATGIHWHLWQYSPHDVNYPEYFPAQPGTEETIAQLNALGQFPMLYINGRRWSAEMQGFRFARPFAVKEQDGQVHESLFPPAPALASMCPACAPWREVVSNLTQRMLRELKAPAVFIDEVGNEPCVPCFDSAHGHPLGGGSWWAEGCRETLRPCAQLCHANGALLTTEGSTEALMDLVDGFLIVAARTPFEVPWYTAVYSGVATYFGSPSHVDDTPESFWMLQARELLNGVVIGWSYPAVLDDARKVEMIRCLCNFRRQHENFFKWGELCDRFRPEGVLPKVTGHWKGRSTAPKQASSKGREVRMPAVIGTVWQSSVPADSNAPGKNPQTARVLFLANLTDKPQRTRARNAGFTGRDITLVPFEIRAIRPQSESVAADNL